MFAKAKHKNTATELGNAFSAVGSPSRSHRYEAAGMYAHTCSEVRFPPNHQPVVAPPTPAPTLLKT